MGPGLRHVRPGAEGTPRHSEAPWLPDPSRRTPMPRRCSGALHARRPRRDVRPADRRRSQAGDRPVERRRLQGGAVGFQAQVLSAKQLAKMSGAGRSSAPPQADPPEAFLIVRSPDLVANGVQYLFAVQRWRPSWSMPVDRTSRRGPSASFDAQQQASALISSDRKTTLVLVPVADQSEAVVSDLRAVAARASGDGYTVQVAGQGDAGRRLHQGRRGGPAQGRVDRPGHRAHRPDRGVRLHRRRAAADRDGAVRDRAWRSGSWR